MTNVDLAEKHAKWYERCDRLMQGTLLRDVRVFEEAAESTDEDLIVRSEPLDLIVLTQSCDIGRDSQPRLLTAEVQTYGELLKLRAGTDAAKSSYRKHLIRNLATSDMLLPPCAELAIDDYLIVNFRELHHVFYKRVKSDQGYVCLASPFREQLSQMFASFVMRVGLPTPPLHEFEKHSGT